MNILLGVRPLKLISQGTPLSARRDVISTWFTASYLSESQALTCPDSVRTREPLPPAANVKYATFAFASSPGHAVSVLEGNSIAEQNCSKARSLKDRSLWPGAVATRLQDMSFSTTTRGLKAPRAPLWSAWTLRSWRSLAVRSLRFLNSSAPSAVMRAKARAAVLLTFIVNLSFSEPFMGFRPSPLTPCAAGISGTS